MRIVILLSFFFTLCSALTWKHIDDDVKACLGIRYAESIRFQQSEAVPLDESFESLNNWPPRCINLKLEEGRQEDCFFLSIFQHEKHTEKKNTLVIISNEELSQKKVASYATSDLNVIVASIRDGILGSFGNNPYGVSDVKNILAFLQSNADQLLVGNVTVWAEDTLAEAVASTLPSVEVSKLILINGHPGTRVVNRNHFAKLATYKIRTLSECDLPSVTQSLDCLRTKSLDEIMQLSDKTLKHFHPFGNPFRAPKEFVPPKVSPMIIGLYKNLGQEYPTDADFDEKYSYKTFKQFLAGLVPDSQHQNGALLRRLLLHQYVHITGDKKNTYHLFEQMRKILLDRDFHINTEKFIKHLKDNKNKVWLLEYGIDNPPKHCLQDGGWENEIKGFCDRLKAYYTRFATLGAPTEDSCDPKNPTFPLIGSAKRDYYVSIKYDGQPEWNFDFYRPECELWNNLLPSLDILELTGRRDSQFVEEQEVDPLTIEDDIQTWHDEEAKKHEEKTEL